jgi:hypothetical protein
MTRRVAPQPGLDRMVSPSWSGMRRSSPAARQGRALARGLEGRLPLQHHHASDQNSSSSRCRVLFLLPSNTVSTALISGIESPALLRENAPNYWEAAWDARRFVEEGARRQLPRDKIGMAINSAASRSQDQLHIHVACIAPKVAEFLRRHQAEIYEAWSFLSAALLGHRFAAMKVGTDSLAHVDPFKLLNRGLPSGKFSVGSQTFRWEVGFKDRLQHQHRCCHADPVPHGRDTGCDRSDVRWRQDRFLSFGQRVWCIAEENRKCGSTA